MKIQLFFGAALLLMIAIGAFIIFDSDAEYVPPDPAAATVPEDSTYAAPAAGVALFSDLIRSDLTRECTLSYRTDYSETVVEGSLLTQAGRVRGDFVQSDTEFGEVVTSYVITGEDLYVWSQIDAETFGVRYAANDMTVANLPVNLNERVRYNCVPSAKIDDSIFELPAGVLFQDAGEIDAEYGTIYESGEFPF